MDLLKLLIFILLVFFTEYNFKFTNLFVTKEGFEDKFSFNTKENFATEKDTYEFKWNTGPKMTGMYPAAKLLTKDYTKYFNQKFLSVLLDDLYLSPPEFEIDNIDVTDGWFGGNFRIVAKLEGTLDKKVLDEYYDYIILRTLEKVVEEYNQNSTTVTNTTVAPVTVAPVTVSPVTKQPYTYKAGTDVYELKWNTGSKMTERYPEAKLLTKDYTKYFHMNILSVILDDLYLSPPEVEIDNIDVTDGWFGGNFRIVAKLYGKLNEEILNEFHDTIIENTLTKVIEEYNQNSNNEGSTNTEASNNVGSTNTEASNNEGSTNTVPKTTAKVYNPEELSIVNDDSSNGERQFLLKVSKNGVENKMKYADQVLTPETVTTYVNEENINLNIDPELKKWIMKKLKENPNILPITKNNTEEESKTVKFKCSS